MDAWQALRATEDVRAYGGPWSSVYCFVRSNFLSLLFCVFPPLLPARDVPKDRCCLVDSQSGKATPAPAGWVSACSLSGQLPPFSLGFPLPGRTHAFGEVPLSPRPSRQVVVHLSFWSFPL